MCTYHVCVRARAAHALDDLEGVRGRLGACVRVCVRIRVYVCVSDLMCCTRDVVLKVTSGSNN